jgi:thiopurine S-methyltransferase
MNFWEERWKNGQTGWHNTQVNDNLVNHHQTLFHVKNPTILVPLCGKSLDMAWLAGQGASIIGIDLVQQAIEEYCAEQNLEPEISTTESCVSYAADSQTLIHANVFDVHTKDIGTVDSIFDRAALVALPLEKREAYALHCLSLLKPGGSILLITYDSPVADDQGPPFPVRKGTVEKLYSSATECVQLDEVLMTQENDERLRNRGLAWSRADIWKITK